MREIEFSADQLVSVLLKLSEQEQVCLLDSCGISNLGSHLLIAGIKPLEVYEFTTDDAEKTLKFFDEKVSSENLASIFTIGYDFGLKLENIKSREKGYPIISEPDIFLAAFDSLIIHDYNTGKTHLTGNKKRFDEIEKILRLTVGENFEIDPSGKSSITSNFTRDAYVAAVKEIQERIRRGDTYQTNLTQQLRARLPENLTAQKIFWQLRKSHPAPFAAFLKRNNDYAVSISPERFFTVQNRIISTSPIKGTRPRGATTEEDLHLRNELLNSEKDLAENTMIVDLLRNDLGRICEFGTIEVEKLCDLETHPTLYHLVSTVRGELREDTNFSDIIKAVFPCGSITGAPKISTMQIIDRLETANRGLSMGAIGCSIPNSRFRILDSKISRYFDSSVTIRTMVIKNREAIFNVGGGIVIDSVPEDEYEETLVKAKALLRALEADFN
jgi:para-aminobenzoate synthetase component 1